MYGVAKSPNSQKKLKTKTKAGDITLLNFRLYYKAVLNRTVWYWQPPPPTTKTQTQRPIEWKPRHELIHIWSINSQQSRKGYTMGKKRYSWDTRVAPKRVTVDSAPIMISGSAEHAWDSDRKSVV